MYAIRSYYAVIIPANTDVTIGEIGSILYQRTSGFVAPSDGQCADTVNLEPGTAITCVIENDDLAEPPQTASVTIIKSVINDNSYNFV